ncbi:MAG: DUF721 domain-containing protein [Candidatus Omnitrophica bacterium]|nr:DUF721 domain-containing protein [Candidatus Omnitrophota bacterium]
MTQFSEKKGSDNIKNIIQKVIGTISESNISKQGKIQQVWDKIAQEEGFQAVKLAGMKDNQITVYVDSSARLYAMKLYKNLILSKIKKEMPEIEKIYFKIGKVK